LAKERKPKTKLLTKLRVLPFFLIVAYILFLLGRTVWQNYGINQEVANLKDDINQLKEENKKLENLIGYYQSTIYKEQEARLKLGYQKPGEKVYVLPKSSEKVTEKSDEESRKIGKAEIITKPNYQKWWEYFFR